MHSNTTVENQRKFIDTCVRIDVIGQIFNFGLAYLSYLILVKTLNVHQYGIYILINSILMFCVTVSLFGLERSVLKFISQLSVKGQENQIPALFKQCFLIIFCIGMTVLFFILAYGQHIMMVFFKRIEIWFAFLALIIASPFFIIMHFNFAVLQGLKKIKQKIIFEKILLNLVTLIAFSIVFILHFKLYGVIIATIFSILLISISTSFYIVSLFPHFKENWRVVSIIAKRDILKFSYPLLLEDILNFILNYADTLLIGYFLTVSKIGIYNIAVKISMLCSFLLYSYGVTFAPLIGEFFHSGDKASMKRLFKMSTARIVSVSFPAFLILLLFGKEILGIFGTEFRFGYYPLIVLSFFQLINASVGCVGYTLIMTGYSKLNFFNALCSVSVNIALNIVLIPKFGILGAAFATGLAFGIFNLLGLIGVFIKHRMHPFSLHFIWVAIAGIAAAFIVRLAKDLVITNMFWLIVLFCLFISLYVLIYKIFSFLHIESGS